MKKLFKRAAALLSAAIAAVSCCVCSYAEEYTSDDEYIPSIELTDGANGEPCRLVINSKDCDAFLIKVTYLSTDSSELTFNGMTNLTDDVIICDSRKTGELIISGFSFDHFDGAVAELDFSGYHCEEGLSEVYSFISFEIIEFGSDGVKYENWNSNNGCNFLLEYSEEIDTVPSIGIYSSGDGSTEPAHTDETFYTSGHFLLYLNIKSEDCDAFLVKIIPEESMKMGMHSYSHNSNDNIEIERKSDYFLISGFTSDHFNGNVVAIETSIDCGGTIECRSIKCEVIAFGADGEDYPEYRLQDELLVINDGKGTSLQQPPPAETTTTDPVQTTTNTTITKSTATTAKNTTTTAKSTAATTKNTTATVKTTVSTLITSTAPINTTTDSSHSSQTADVVVVPGEKTNIAKPEVVGGGTVSFISADTSVATVDGKGIVQGVGAGTTDIYIIQDGTVVDIVTVEVKSSHKKGDVDRDGDIDIFDAVAVAKYTVKRLKLDSEQLDLADVTENDNVDVFDAVMIAKHTVGVAFPWE